MNNILIVEDEPLIALDLSIIVRESFGAEVTLASSVSAARRVIDDNTRFVFLDMNVIDGTTFELARMLLEWNVPFAFATGSRRSDVPGDLQFVPFLSKPCTNRDVKRVLTVLDASGGAVGRS